MSEHLSKTCQRTHLGKIARQVLLTEPYDISNDIAMHDMFDFDGVLSLCLCRCYLWHLWLHSLGLQLIAVVLEGI